MTLPSLLAVPRICCAVAYLCSDKFLPVQGNELLHLNKDPARVPRIEAEAD